MTAINGSVTKRARGKRATAKASETTAKQLNGKTTLRRPYQTLLSCFLKGS